MQVLVQSYSAPKSGNTPDEYEDAYYPRHPGLFMQQGEFRAAVADGATEASFSDVWAKLLVRAYFRGRLDQTTFLKNLSSLQAEWSRRVDRKSCPWYVEEKLRQGAFSTIAGLTLHGDIAPVKTSGEWSAIAVGDSCLFQVRRDELVASFPYQKSIEFSSRPFLIPSAHPLEGDIVHVRGGWEWGDEFFLMTDALAKWFLCLVEVGAKPWHGLYQLVENHDGEIPCCTGPIPPDPDSAELRYLRESVRKSGVRLQNDDITLLCVRPQPIWTGGIWNASGYMYRGM